MQTCVVDNMKHEMTMTTEENQAFEQNIRERVHYVASFVTKMPLMAVDRRIPSRSLSGLRSLITDISARYEIERVSRFFFFSLSLSLALGLSVGAEPFRCVGRALVRHNKMYVSDIRLSPPRGPLRAPIGPMDRFTASELRLWLSLLVYKPSLYRAAATWRIGQRLAI